MNTLGQAIRFVRTVKEVQQKDVAEHIGVSVGYLSSIERDRRTPHLPMLQQIANELGVRVSTFFLLAEMEDPSNSKYAPLVFSEIFTRVAPDYKAINFEFELARLEDEEVNA